jgi:hypothetical protein
LHDIYLRKGRTVLLYVLYVLQSATVLIAKGESLCSAHNKGNAVFIGTTCSVSGFKVLLRTCSFIAIFMTTFLCSVFMSCLVFVLKAKF